MSFDDQVRKEESHCKVPGKAVCSNPDLLERLDGFSINPRVSVCFSGAVDASTLKAGISFVPVANPVAAPININQVVVDQSLNCIYAKPEQLLNQRTRYLLLVRNSVQDAGRAAVTADPAFASCLSSGQPYCASLASALNGVPDRQSVVGASLFTTLDATGWLEKAYQYVNRTEPGVVLPAGFPWLYPISTLRDITWNPDTGTTPAPKVSIPVSSALNSISSVAFGFYLSPNYLNTDSTKPDVGAITTSPDQPVAVPQLLGGLTFGYVPVSFHVFLPSKPAPAGGYPVVIYGHGLGDSQFGAPSYIASTLAEQGYATLALEITGHGFGPGGTVTLTDKLGFKHDVMTPGRGVQLGAGQPIGPSSGCVLPGAVAIRDCARQTAVDLFALIKTIQRTSGMGLGLNPQAISYVGQSFGSIYGSLLHAVAPDVKAAVLNAGGGPFTDVARLAVTGRSLGVTYLCGLGLLNVAPAPGAAPVCDASGFNRMDAQSEMYFHDTFNDSYVYREDGPKLDPEPGALEIQAAFEAAEWVGMPGDALSYAPHFKKAPLPGVPAKNFLLQFSDFDLEVPNPTNIALAAAAGDDSTIRFKFGDALMPLNPYGALAGVVDPMVSPLLPILPHRVLTNPTIFGTAFPNQLERSIAIAEQKTVADFFSRGGSSLPDANQYLDSLYTPRQLFENGAHLPPGLVFVNIPQ